MLSALLLLLSAALMIWHDTLLKPANNSEHISDSCITTSHSGMTSLYTIVADQSCCCLTRRSANESAVAGLRLATRRRRRRWRRTVEDCSNSSNSPKAPRILTEFVCRQGGDKESKRACFFFFAFFSCMCLYLLLEWCTESQKSEGGNTCPQVRGRHIMKQFFPVFLFFFSSPPCVS